jgi:hypothetical protein
LGVTGSYLKAGTSFLKRVAEGYLELVSDLKKAGINFIINFSPQKDSQIL